MKKVVSLILCCVMLMAALALSGCGSGDYKDAFDAYMKAEDDLDSDAIIKLLPPDMYDYLYDYYKERADARGLEISDEEIKENINMRYESKISSMDAAKLDKDIDLVNDLSYSYDIEEEYKASSGEINEFNKYVKENLGFKTKAQDIVLIKYRYTIKNKDEVYLDIDNVTSYGMCIKMGGKWYYAEANLDNEKMWVDREGLRVNSSVDWVFEWFKN